MAVNLTTSMLLADLKAGLTRKEIGLKYGLNGIQIKEIFSNQHLKNKKTIKEKGIAYVLIDDLEDDQVAEPVGNVNLPEDQDSEMIDMTELEGILGEDHQVAENDITSGLDEVAEERNMITRQELEPAGRNLAENLLSANNVIHVQEEDEVIEIPDPQPTRTRRQAAPAPIVDEDVKTSELGW